MEEENVREKILDSAEIVFSEYGLAGARVAQITDRAGVNKAMLYYYFGGKEAIFQAVLNRNAETIFNLINSITVDSDNFEEYLRSFVTAYQKLIHSKPHFVRLVVWDLLSGGEHFAQTLGYHINKVQPIILKFAEEQRAGKFNKDINPVLLIPSIVAPYLLFSLASNSIKNPITAITKTDNLDEIWPEYTKTAMTILMQGIQASPSSDQGV